MVETPPSLQFPYTIDDIVQAWDQIAEHVERTPVLAWHRPDQIAPDLDGTRITLKLEVFQKTGTFKIRGALLNMMSLTPAERGKRRSGGQRRQSCHRGC